MEQVAAQTAARLRADDALPFSDRIVCGYGTYELADAHGVELPIANVVRGIVWEGLDARSAAESLASRPLTTEFYGL